MKLITIIVAVFFMAQSFWSEAYTYSTNRKPIIKSVAEFEEFKHLPGWDVYMNASRALESRQYLVAFEQFKASSTLGFPAGDVMLGRMYMEGLGIPINFQLASKWFLNAREKHVKFASVYLGILYSLEGNPDKNYQKAIDFYKEGVIQGDVYSEFNLGLLYFNKKEVRDYEKALVFFKLAASKGDSDAMFYIGKYYREGILFEKNIDESLVWFEKAADKGDLDAKFMLGITYLERKDKRKMRDGDALWLSNAKQGHAMSQYYIGLRMLSGKGDFNNKKCAKYWIDKSSEQGYEKATNWLRKFGEKYSSVNYRYDEEECLREAIQ